MAVRFPILIGEIELDAAALDFTAADPNRRVGKIGTGFAVPRAELHDLDLLAGGGGKGSPEIAGKPARLQFQLAEIAREGKERTLANFRRREELRVTLGAGHDVNDQFVRFLASPRMTMLFFGMRVFKEEPRDFRCRMTCGRINRSDNCAFHPSMCMDSAARTPTIENKT